MKNQAETLKLCCADFYQQAAVKFFLGDSFHPGGLKLTEILAQHLGISKESQMLDIACGEGTSAFFIAERFHAKVTGMDAGKKAVQTAQEKAAVNSSGNRVNFLQADSDSLPFPDSSFNDCITECSFSTFVEKEKTAREIYRILKPGGKWGLSDMLVKQERLPKTMKSGLLRSERTFRKFTCENVSEQATSTESALFQAACIGQAKNFPGYAAHMKNAGFRIVERQDASWALEEMIAGVERRLNQARLLAGCGSLPVKPEDLDSVEKLITEGRELLRKKIIGCGIVVGQKPA